MCHFLALTWLISVAVWVNRRPRRKKRSRRATSASLGGCTLFPDIHASVHFYSHDLEKPRRKFGTFIISDIIAWKVCCIILNALVFNHIFMRKKCYLPTHIDLYICTWLCMWIEQSGGYLWGRSPTRYRDRYREVTPIQIPIQHRRRPTRIK
jgi:hypothetical protein